MKVRALAFVAMAALALFAAGAPAGIGDRTARLRVGYVTDAGAATDGGIGERMYDGFVRAVREFGVEGHVLEVPQNQPADSALAAFGRRRYDLIIAGSFIQDGPVNRAARRFPRSRFFFTVGPSSMLDHRLRNVRGMVIRVEQSGFLAGYLAGLMETRRPGKDIVGAVGGFPQVPDVTNYIVGYRLGARRADPGVTVLAGYSQDFVNPRKCRAVALREIADGAGAVFQVAGRCGLGALQAARAQRVWGIGVDVDQSSLGPHILTSAVSKTKIGVELAIRELKNGTFKPGTDVVLTLSNGGVGLGRISPKVPPAFLDRLEGIRRQIVVGRITIPRVPG